MENYELLLCVILVALIGMFVYFACALSNLKDDMRRMYMNSASDYTVRNAKKEILTEMDDQIDKVMIEIACLATKNNADIQRVREGYKPGDVIDYKGQKVIVLNCLKDNYGRFDEYRIYYLEEGELFDEDREKVEKYSKFLRHVDLGLKEAE